MLMLQYSQSSLNELLNSDRHVEDRFRHLECVVLLKVRIFFFFFSSGRWKVAMLH